MSAQKKPRKSRRKPTLLTPANKSCHSIIMVRVHYEREARKQLDRLPLAIKGRVLRLVERLGQWPEVSGAKPLSGQLAGHYRMRTGDYRLQFRIEAGEVVIEKIGHRDRFYEE